jgi:protein-disulfide isomerase
MAKKAEKVNFQKAVIGVLMLVVIGGAFWVGRLTTELKLLKDQPGTANQAAQQPQVAATARLSEADWQALLKDSAAVRGEENAPVVMVEFTDYQCPFCKRAFEQTYPEIKKQYIDTGKVRYLVHDLPLPIHPNAPAAALAARCAGEQGRYWPMHDAIFAGQDDWANGKVDELMRQYARGVGVNAGQFNNCYDGAKYQTVVEADAALAARLGATGTPTFFINGRTLVGAQPIAAFKAVIEEELGK